MATAEQPVLVPPEVSREKLASELELWRANAELYRRRGLLLLGEDDLRVDIGLCAAVPAGGPLRVLGATVRMDFANYDLWPASVEFIDPMTGEFLAPWARAPVPTMQGPRDLLVDAHPVTGRAFLCVPGTREYHSHPQHSGDDWLLHRETKAGTLATLCDRLWRAMVRNVIGLAVTTNALPNGMGPPIGLQLLQMDPDELMAQQLAQMPGGQAPAAPDGVR